MQMNILLIDDSSAILTLIGDYLKKLGHGVLVANSGSDGITMIEHDFPDLVITDLSMPEVDGFEVLEFIYNDNPDLPVIVMSALDNPNDIIRALRAGAWDYVIKPIEPLDIIEFTIERVEKKLELIRKNLEYKNNLEQMVEERTNFLNIVLNSIGDGVISTNKLGDVLYMNPEAVRLLGYSLEEIEGHNLNRYFKIFNSKTSKEEVSIINKVLNGFKEPVRLNNIVLVGRKGDMFQLSSVATALFSEDGTLIGSVLVFRDITDEYELQESLNHKNKMNSMGVLVGGVAHDFNNMLMLSGIMGCAQLLKAPKRSLTDDNLKFVDMILKSSKQGADLVKKLLIFGHKGKTMLLFF
ncbi:MAG: hypothetical protein B6229_10360 [Spirochaetaceae bacterium 4572_7]|nr:MAG: hypothetical protein B6229_10360 [Spirochaetaceae bacterium 4572_7]